MYDLYIFVVYSIILHLYYFTILKSVSKNHLVIFPYRLKKTYFSTSTVRKNTVFFLNFT